MSATNCAYTFKIIMLSLLLSSVGPALAGHGGGGGGGWHGGGNGGNNAWHGGNNGWHGGNWNNNGTGAVILVNPYNTYYPYNNYNSYTPCQNVRYCDTWGNCWEKTQC